MVQWYNYALFHFYFDFLIIFPVTIYYCYNKIYLLIERKITLFNLFPPTLMSKVIPGSCSVKSPRDTNSAGASQFG